MHPPVWWRNRKMVGFVNLIRTTPREYDTDLREYRSPQGDHPPPHKPFYLEKGVLGIL